MPICNSLKKVLVIGSGPIIIGQAAEFDYAGTQACKALRSVGIQVVLINSNPATIMTDKAMADRIYIEPLTLDVVKRVILEEKPDAVLSTLGGQTGLTLSMQLAKEGFLDAHGVRLLGARVETIDKAEDRQLFKDTMRSIGEPSIPSRVVTSIQDALDFAKTIGYPVIVRPAFTMGGTGGGIAKDPEALIEIARNGLRLSPITQILVERDISGWKEIEFEVIRDAKGNAITVCSMENFDPVGIHTGDSIVVAPCQTLSNREFQMLRTAALKIVEALGVEGGCNCQFALNPENFNYAVIEVNPRVSRSSALASKATGYPIAKVASLIAVGLSLDEIPNDITGKTTACFEPAIDYLVVKFPRWPFDKFVYGERTLGTQMKATGEVMSIGNSFEQAMMKAIRSIELGYDTLRVDRYARMTNEDLLQAIRAKDDQRAFVVYEALYREFPVERLVKETGIDRWFLDKLINLARVERDLTNKGLRDFRADERVALARQLGFMDKTIERLAGEKIPPVSASFKMVDTCAGEFQAQTPYFYSTKNEENEAKIFLQDKDRKKRILIFGSGPIRIGQGIEFDYCSVHCARTLKEMGAEAVIINNNPETVSTDFDTSDRLYFEPLTPEDVRSVVESEQPDGCIVQFGGQTAIKLAEHEAEIGVPILGTSADAIDRAEDRERFEALLEKLGIPRPEARTAMTADQALAAANDLGYPVLLRPSYVLGGQNMAICKTDEDVSEYMEIILRSEIENPILIDKYLVGKEVEVDVISDGTDVLLPGIMEHVERAGIHSGDSISVYPPQSLTQKVKNTIVDYSIRLAKELQILGLMNVQYVVQDEVVYVIEVNPRSSRTIPYLSKVTDIPMVQIATRIVMGQTLKDMGYATGLAPEKDFVCVKVPVFSFSKLHDVDTQLGPEMKSTGEVLGIAKTYPDALYKGFVAAGIDMVREGGVLVSVKDADKAEAVDCARRFADLGFKLYATAGTAAVLDQAGLSPERVLPLSHSESDLEERINSGQIQIMLSTSERSGQPQRDSVKLRRKAVESSLTLLTAIDTTKALLSCLESGKTLDDIALVELHSV